MTDEIELFPHSVTLKSLSKDGRAYWEIKIRSANGNETDMPSRLKQIHEQMLNDFPFNVYKVD